MMLDLRRDRDRVVDGNHAIAASAVVIGAIALADVRVAALAVAVLVPLLLLAKRGNATLRSSWLSVENAGPLAKCLRGAGSIALVEVQGPLLFLSVPHIDRLLADRPPWPSYVILDLRAVTTIDASALAALRDLLHEVTRCQGSFLLVAAPGTVSEALRRSGLTANALGGTTCFQLEHALERIATRHAHADLPPGEPRVARAHLQLVHSAPPHD